MTNVVRISSVLICALFLSACKNATPELVNMFAEESNGGASSSELNKGRVTAGSDYRATSSSNYKAVSRVPVTPQQVSSSTSSNNYKVRGSIVY